MSLPESLLLDPPRLDVWLALRTDGSQGSGTESDPYHAGVVTQPQFAVTSLTRDTNPEIAIAVTGSIKHEYVAGDIVMIAGATGTGSEHYNGTFRILSVTATSFKYKMSDDPGADASGSITCQLDSYLFDNWMRRTPKNTAVHIGPGTIETRGYSSKVFNKHPTWEPKEGMKILGSGIDVTTLKITNAGFHNGTYLQRGIYYAISAPFDYASRYLEVSDLTIDCNMAGQPHSPGLEYADLACAAIGVNGDFIRIRRVKAIHWGTQTLPVSGTDPGQECFVIKAASVHPLVLEFQDSESIHPVIEDCICAQPNENNARESTVLHMGGGENPNDHTLVFSRGPVVRRNLVDCGFSGGRTNLLITASSSSWSGATGRGYFKWKRPHTRQQGEYVRIMYPYSPFRSNNKWNGYFKIVNVIDDDEFEVEMPDPGSDPHDVILLGSSFHALSMGTCRSGVVEENRVFNTWIGGPYKDTHHSRELTVRRNYYRNVVTGVYLFRGRTSGPAGLHTLTHDGVDALATTDPDPDVSHRLIVGDRVKISGAAHPEYEGFFEVSGVPANNQFKYIMQNTPAGAGGEANVQRVWGVDKVVVEDNIFELTEMFGGEWGGTGAGVRILDNALINPPPPHVFGEVVIRNNIVRYVDGATNPSLFARGALVLGAKKVIVEHNVIDVDWTHPLEVGRCGSVYFFNNRKSFGELIQGYDIVTTRNYEEPATRITDAFLLAW